MGWEDRWGVEIEDLWPCSNISSYLFTAPLPLRASSTDPPPSSWSLAVISIWHAVNQGVSSCCYQPPLHLPLPLCAQAHQSESGCQDRCHDAAAGTTPGRKRRRKTSICRSEPSKPVSHNHRCLCILTSFANEDQRFTNQTTILFIQYITFQWLLWLFTGCMRINMSSLFISI